VSWFALVISMLFLLNWTRPISGLVHQGVDMISCQTYSLTVYQVIDFIFFPLYISIRDQVCYKVVLNGFNISSRGCLGNLASIIRGPDVM
jgi:hypothetical protein